MGGHKSRAQRVEERGICRVYWGSHGCSKPRGHTGIHFCSSGCIIPNEETKFFGEDIVPGDTRIVVRAVPTEQEAGQ